MNKIYPRLERRKLKRLEAGKRELFSTLEEREMYTKVFLNTLKSYESSIGINTDGLLTASTIGDGVVEQYDDDGDAIYVKDDVQTAESTDSIKLTIFDLQSIRNAIHDGCAPAVFACMMEAKAIGMPYEYKRRKAIVAAPAPKKHILGARNAAHRVQFEEYAAVVNF